MSSSRPGRASSPPTRARATIERRLNAVGVESTEENRRSYRDLLFTTAGAAEHISGVILFDETIRQRSADGTPFPELLERQGIIPGIKVDLGAKPLALFPGETVTEGLDGLRDRFAEYRGLGARFAKWRAVISIGDGIPSEYAVWVNAHALARYAALAQEAGLVPIVEPEVVMDGEHSIDRSYHVTSQVQNAVFTELHDQRVELTGMLPSRTWCSPARRRRAGRGRDRGRGHDQVPSPPRAPAVAASSSFRAGKAPRPRPST